MLELFGDTQKIILKVLAKSPEGLTIEQLAEAALVSRNAVNQHMASLEKNHFVQSGSVVQTGGRPSRTYRLSSQGRDLFPKQYPWFSELILQAIKEEHGATGLSGFLKKMAQKLATEIKKTLKGKTTNEKILEVASLMSSLSYEASAVPAPNRSLKIDATNCVYHHLASKHPEVCDFDTELLSNLLESKVNHDECMVKGQNKCRFSFTRISPTNSRK